MKKVMLSLTASHDGSPAVVDAEMIYKVVIERTTKGHAATVVWMKIDEARQDAICVKESPGEVLDKMTEAIKAMGGMVADIRGEDSSTR